MYIESTDVEHEHEEEDDSIIPPLTVGDQLEMKIIEARQRWSQKPSRYTEASLVKKLEELRNNFV